MNAVTPIVAAPTGWEEAGRAVHHWRGQLIHWFARGEVAVSETLLTLAALDRGEDCPRLRHLWGQRLEDLGIALSPDGPFATEGKRAAEALASFREHEQVRNDVCHGVTKVWLERNGGWAVTVELLAIRGGKPERRSTFWKQQDAEALSKEVGRRCQRLEAALGALRGAVTAA